MCGTKDDEVVRLNPLAKICKETATVQGQGYVDRGPEPSGRQF